MATRVDLLQFLLKNTTAFSSMPRAQQLELAKNRPTPILDLQEYVNGNKVNFQAQWYTTYEWLTGSLSSQTLLCFVCLLYGNIYILSRREKDFVNFYDKANDHQNCIEHIRNSEKYALLLNYKKTESIQKRESCLNEVKRKTIKKIIKLFYFTVKVMYKDIETNELNILEESLSFLSNNEIILPMGATFKFTDIAYDVKKNFAAALTDIAKKIIMEELKQVNFISAGIDVDDNKPNRFNLTVRYVYNNKTYERFLTSFETTKFFNSDELIESSLKHLEDWGIGDKLVCISYDNPKIYLSSENIKICFQKEDYIKPLILYNCNYNLCNIVWQSCKKIISISSFFDNLTTVYEFFHDKRRFIKLTDEGIALPKNMFPYNNRSKAFSCPKNYLSSFAKNFQKIKNAICHIIQNRHSSWDYLSIFLANEMLAYFSDQGFVLIIVLFNRLFLQIDHLACFFRLLSYRNIPRFIQELEQTTTTITMMDSDEKFNELWEEGLEILGQHYRMKTCNHRDLKNKYSKIIRLTVKNIKTRFSDFYSLGILELINFKRYDVKYTSKILNGILEKYLDNFNILNFTKLVNELHIIYADSKKHMDPDSLLIYFHSNDLFKVYNETVKLIQFVLSLPLTSISNDNKTKYERIKRTAEFLDNNSALFEYEFILNEKDLFDKLILEDSFIERVIDVLEENVDFEKIFTVLEY